MLSKGMLLSEDRLTLPLGNPLRVPGGSGNCSSSPEAARAPDCIL